MFFSKSVKILVLLFGSYMSSSFQTNEIASCHNSCASKHGHCSTVLKLFVITSKRIMSLKKEVQLQRSCRWSNCNQVNAYGDTTYLIDIAQNTIVIQNLVAVFCLLEHFSNFISALVFLFLTGNCFKQQQKARNILLSHFV